ncbi:MAG: uroporphyrinogen decarboxylase family protein [Candidatus Thorarchaeota archaeon]
MRFSTEYVQTTFRAYADCGAKVYLEGGNIAHKGEPMINPKYFNKYLLPSYQEVLNAIHDWCGKYILHTDGDITLLLDFIIESGFDGLQCLELSYVDPTLVKRKIGDKICFSGNIDTRNNLVDASKKEVEQAVKNATKALGHGGGFILSPANFQPGISVDRLKWMIETAGTHGVYSLAL